MSDTQEIAVVHRSPALRKGYSQIPHAVLTDTALSDGAVRLYGMLLSYAFQTESLKRSQKKMAADLDKEDRTIRRLLKELDTRGLVTPQRSGNREVNVYIIEDAYALYDAERPKPGGKQRTEKRADKNVLSESERTGMSSHGGQKCPVVGDKNVLLLKNPQTKKEEKESPAAPGVLTSSSSERRRADKRAPEGLATLRDSLPVDSGVSKPWAVLWSLMSQPEKNQWCRRVQGIPANDVAGTLREAKRLFRESLAPGDQVGPADE